MLTTKSEKIKNYIKNSLIIGIVIIMILPTFYSEIQVDFNKYLGINLILFIFNTINTTNKKSGLWISIRDNVLLNNSIEFDPVLLKSLSQFHLSDIKQFQQDKYLSQIESIQFINQNKSRSTLITMFHQFLNSKDDNMILQTSNLLINLIQKDDRQFDKELFNKIIILLNTNPQFRLITIFKLLRLIVIIIDNNIDQIDLFEKSLMDLLIKKISNLLKILEIEKLQNLLIGSYKYLLKEYENFDFEQIKSEQMNWLSLYNYNFDQGTSTVEQLRYIDKKYKHNLNKQEFLDVQFIIFILIKQIRYKFFTQSILLKEQQNLLLNQESSQPKINNIHIIENEIIELDINQNNLITILFEGENYKNKQKMLFSQLGDYLIIFQEISINKYKICLKQNLNSQILFVFDRSNPNQLNLGSKNKINFFGIVFPSFQKAAKSKKILQSIQQNYYKKDLDFLINSLMSIKTDCENQLKLQMFKKSLRLFSEITKKPQMELTIRTPYKTILADFKDFQRIVAKTNEAILIVQNKMPPAVHMLPPGQIMVRTNNPVEDFSGEIMHLGGWLVIHSDNSCEINLMEGVDKKEIQPEQLSKKDFVQQDDPFVEKIQNSTYGSFLKQMGGTKIAGEQYCVSGGKVVKQWKLNTKDYQDIKEVMEVVIGKMEGKIQRCSIAIAGLVSDNTFKGAVNIPWKGFSNIEIQEEFGIKQCFVLNDFQSVGYSVNHFKQDNLKVLNEGKGTKGNLLVMGIGTGVGLAIVHSDSQVIHSEFSQVNALVKNDFDFQIMKLMRKSLKKELISIENMISAYSLSYLYNIIQQIENTELGKQKYKQLLGESDVVISNQQIEIDLKNDNLISPEEIYNKYQQKEVTSHFTILYYLEILGNCIYLLSLTHLPLGQLILTGTFIKQLLSNLKEKEMDLFKQNIFLNTFMKDNLQKSNYSFYIGNEQLELIGGLQYLKDN